MRDTQVPVRVLAGPPAHARGTTAVGDPVVVPVETRRVGQQPGRYAHPVLHPPSLRQVVPDYLELAVDDEDVVEGQDRPADEDAGDRREDRLHRPRVDARDLDAGQAVRAVGGAGDDDEDVVELVGQVLRPLGLLDQHEDPSCEARAGAEPVQQHPRDQQAAFVLRHISNKYEIFSQKHSDSIASSPIGR